MLFGYFLYTTKILSLFSKSKILFEYPEMCSSGSNLIPHILKPVDQVIPKPIETDNPKYSKYFIPLFVAIKDGTILENPVGSFHLVFYPNPKDLPAEHKNKNKDRLAQEYWASIQPMIICRNVSGYYLGKFNDPNTILFEICERNAQKCLGWIRKAKNGFNTSTCYGKDVEFEESYIYLRRSTLT